MTAYSKLILKGYVSQSSTSGTTNVNIGISKNTIGNTNLAAGCERVASSVDVSSTSNTAIEIVMDISDINGEYYVYFEHYSTDVSGKYPNTLIDVIRVE